MENKIKKLLSNPEGQRTLNKIFQYALHYLKQEQRRTLSNYRLQPKDMQLRDKLGELNNFILLVENLLNKEEE